MASHRRGQRVLAGKKRILKRFDLAKPFSVLKRLSVRRYENLSPLEQWTYYAKQGPKNGS